MTLGLEASFPPEPGPAQLRCLGAFREGKGAAPGLVRSSSTAGEPQNVMTVSESRKGLGTVLKKDTQILSFPFLSLLLEGILEI